MVLPHAVLLIKLQYNNYQFNQRTKVVEVCFYMRCSHDSHFYIENNLFCTFPHSRAEVKFLEEMEMALKLWLYVTEVVKRGKEG